MDNKRFSEKDYDRILDDIINEFFEQHNAQFDSKEALKIELLQTGENIPQVEQFGQSDKALKESMNPSDWQEEYSKNTPHWAKDLEPSIFARDFSKLMKEYNCKSVLEIGCGNGRDSIYFAKQGFKVTGIDITPEAVVLARKNVNRTNKTVKIEIGNAEELSYDNSSFNAVYSLSVLHSTDLTKSIPEIYRVLSSEGLAFIFIYSSTQFRSGKTDKAKIDTDQYLSQLIDIGFTILEVYQEDEDKFDDSGEKHHKFIVTLLKGEA